MKKGGFFRNVLDTIRSNQTNQQSASSGSSNSSSNRANEFGGQLKAHHFALCQVARHGFPENPSALAFDPVQKIAAIGTKSGALRIFGRPGVDIWVQHKPEFAITHIKFIINQGAIITVTADESIHLWSLRGSNLKLQLSTAGGSSPSGQATSQSASATLATHLANSAAAAAAAAAAVVSDSGAQPGDPDYLLEQKGSSSQSSADQAKHSCRRPEILHTLKFQREHITCLHQTLMSKWLFIGTERGNVHVANVETFELSGYSIPWNKAIELSRKSHPGSVIHISECPQDTNKLLIGYETGCIVLWDLKNRTAEGRYYHADNLLWLSWHYEGKQFVASHADGSLITWQTRSNLRPIQVLHPHAKTTTSQQQQQQTSTTGELLSTDQAFHQTSLASSFARALNNELYRPINKVEWKTAKTSNEQFLLFSGGLPYDGLDSKPLVASSSSSSATTTTTTHQAASPSFSASQPTNARLSAATAQQFSQHLKATSPVSPIFGSSSSTPSPSLSPASSAYESLIDNKSTMHQQQQSSQQQLQSTTSLKERRNLRSTSLTVMYGKSITVLEMDDTIVDFITVCDNSPYENDTSDPYAVLVLLHNDLILIDLTSSGYPSFESPYPANVLNDSPVTCVQYLADCSSDLIPFLYSTSQNVISRAPKKGFSDKEWPINGGEWGQPMQSYPELVVTGHADGTIKFWDMSGVNFDLISKIKTSKLFERPNKPVNSIIVSGTSYNQQQTLNNARRTTAATNIKPTSPQIDQHSQHQHNEFPSSSSSPSADLDSNQSSTDQHPSSPPLLQQQNNSIISLENYYAIEQIEYCPSSKHLLVAGALSQVIQFKLNKKDSTTSTTASCSAPEVSTVIVEPQAAAINNNNNNELSNQSQQRHHLLLKAKSLYGPAGSSSSGSSSSSVGPGRARSNGFHPDLICLTPSLLNPINPMEHSLGEISLVCIAPPRITAIALQANHSILAYAHEQGLVLVDTIQKCVIMNASLSDLYGGASIMTNNRDINIQPFATSSTLQHHYQSNAPSATLPVSPSSALSSSTATATLSSRENPSLKSTTNNNITHNNGVFSDNSGSGSTVKLASAQTHDNGPSSDININTASLQKSAALNESIAASQFKQNQSRFIGNNSMFQRQLSTTALLSSPSSGNSRPASAQPAGNSRLFQRQLTASQLFSTSSSSSDHHHHHQQQQQHHPRLTRPNSGQVARGSDLGGSALSLSGQQLATATAAPGSSNPNSRSPRRDAQQAVSANSSNDSSVEQQQQARKPAKNRRIISRMLSISAIHSPSSSGSSVAEPTFNTEPDALSQLGDQTPDRIDSSFTRSRSSSSGSTAAPQLNQAADSSGFSSSNQWSSELLLSLCFLDYSNLSTATHQLQQQSNVGAAAAAAAAAASGQAATSTASLGSSTNNKSPNLIAQASEGGQQLALWVGTSQGCVLLLTLTMPDTEDNRVLQLQSVQVEPVPQAAIKMPGALLSLATFSAEASRAPPSGSLVSQSSSLEGEQVSGSGSGPATAVAGAALGQADSSASSGSLDTRLATFLCVISEKEARVYQIPVLSSSGNRQSPANEQHSHSHSHHQHHQSAHHSSSSTVAGDSPIAKLLSNPKQLVARADLSESSYAARASLVQMRQPDESCLLTYLATGNLRVHSLPSLKLLMDADFVPYSDPLIARSMCFSRNAHALYRPSQSEICKFTLSAQYKALVNEMTGSLYVAREMPEMPRANFFKSLFSVTSSVTSRHSDRDELFSECAAGKASRTVAKHISATGSTLDKLKGAASGTVGHELRAAREGLDERGEKLGELEDRTLQMMNQSESYSQAAHQLAQKFKDKKWYQF